MGLTACRRAREFVVPRHLGYDPVVTALLTEQTLFSQEELKGEKMRNNLVS